MIVCIDESGDQGFKIQKGSSQLFTIALVFFDDRAEAIACDKRIELLKREVGWKPRSEFHFKRNSHTVRSAFFEAVKHYNFFYYAVVIDKGSKKMDTTLFKNKQSFYTYTCGLVFQNAKEQLEDATVIIDESGNEDFRRQLAAYLRLKLNENSQQIIKKIKMQRSSSNNLLQLADYVAGAVNRSMQQKRMSPDEYRKHISHRELGVEIWPK